MKCGEIILGMRRGAKLEGPELREKRKLSFGKTKRINKMRTGVIFGDFEVVEIC
jgi:hypothetical protein